MDLQQEPGTEYSYSGFGYCVLARVIEELSGQSYESFVQETVLEPIGADGMKIAKNMKSEKYENEGTYYSSTNWIPYYPQLNVERKDAGGGWLGSAVDLARFLLHLDGSAPDLISRPTYDLMVTPSSANAGYAKGWAVNPKIRSKWQTGVLPGTGAFVMTSAKGVSAVFLMNHSWLNEIKPMVWEAINGIKNWS